MINLRELLLKDELTRVLQRVETLVDKSDKETATVKKVIIKLEDYNDEMQELNGQVTSLIDRLGATSDVITKRVSRNNHIIETLEEFTEEEV